VVTHEVTPVSIIVLKVGSLRITVKHTVQKRGIWFYRRRIPADLAHHYPPNQTHLYESLQTRDPSEAAKKAVALAAKHDALWASMRSPEGQAVGLTTQENTAAALALLDKLGLSQGDINRDASHVADVMDDYMASKYGEAYLQSRFDDAIAQVRPVESFYNSVEAEAIRLLRDDPSKRRPHLSDAVEVYLKHHAKGQETKFQRDTKRAIGQLETVAGNLPLDLYNRSHAHAVVEQLLAQGNKTGTVRRRLNVIKAVISKAILELELKGMSNPFERIDIPNLGSDATKREPFTDAELAAIAEECLKRNDSIRHLVAIQADTGARLGEVVGLRIEDLFLDHKVPHLWIRPHERLGRTLKNRNSARKVPLVGVALWGATQALKASKGQKSGWLFPRYAADNNIKATSASKATNTWLRKITDTDKTSHSLRHSMRDRLRHVGTPEDIQDAIGGWSSQSVGRGYGEGYKLEKLQEWLARVALK